MVLIQAGTHSHTNTIDRPTTPEAGPVFVPPRRPSAFARSLLEETAETDDAVTAYDELWFAGRPTV
ncbi:MAG: hypothetical protein MPN21_06135 [Thermoanaerobaculia bacterium]|nr:hypothetical protein [Thermoanaerobaculia bacterium]